MQSLETLELLSYLVTIVGFPLAIFVFIYEQRRERENEEESVYHLREWCRRADFRRLLPQLLKGEDPEFVEYFRALAAQEMPSVADLAAAPRRALSGRPYLQAGFPEVLLLQTRATLISVLPRVFLRQIMNQSAVGKFTPHTTTEVPDARAADLPEHSADIRLGLDLLRATRPFAHEIATKSWWYVSSTFALMIAALAGAGLARSWEIRTALAILGALLMVRVFITYHDFMHGAILRDSPLASLLFHVYGAFALTPARSWKASHNYHHGHVGQISFTSIGAFPIITTRMWREASRAQRVRYRANRHPLVVLFGYLTIFAFSICLAPLLRDPRKHWDSALSPRPRRTDCCAVGAGRLRFGFLCSVAADDRRGNARQLSVLCAAQFQTHADPLAGVMDLLSSCAGVLELHAPESGHAMVHGQYRLSPHSPPQCAHTLLSLTRSDGRDPRAPGANHHSAHAAGNRQLFPVQSVG